MAIEAAGADKRLVAVNWTRSREADRQTYQRERPPSVKGSEVTRNDRLAIGKGRSRRAGSGGRAGRADGAGHRRRSSGQTTTGAARSIGQRPGRRVRRAGVHGGGHSRDADGLGEQRRDQRRGGVARRRADRGEGRRDAETEARAREIAGAVQLNPTLDQVGPTGPRTREREGWSVSYRLNVPRALNMALRTSNGGITIRDMDSKVEFRTTNGGVKLVAVNGDVRGQTTNGGVDIDLDGSSGAAKGSTSKRPTAA